MHSHQSYSGCTNGNTVELPLLRVQPLHTVILAH